LPESGVDAGSNRSKCEGKRAQGFWKVEATAASVDNGVADAVALATKQLITLEQVQVEQKLQFETELAEAHMAVASLTKEVEAGAQISPELRLLEEMLDNIPSDSEDLLEETLDQVKQGEMLEQILMAAMKKKITISQLKDGTY
jgi:hypothetical protein